MADPAEHAPDLPQCPAASENGLLPAELRAWMVLLATTGGIEQRLGPVLKETLGVSHDEFLVLSLLANRPDGGLRMTRIAELLGRPKTRLTYQIACLQHAGLVTRRAVCGDKRGVEVALTEKGRRAFVEASPALVESVTSGLAGIRPEEREVMCGLLPEVAGEEKA
ncbi:MarR family winged helix-turn-helix transcriptional regulator [Streptomyces geranii]|uniref:MarR family winged helix-turn-helix transcriptional regulator n=1 Tax=Streptomyces geranii TaxID=2058923 RepID=UPI000D02543D|nr:MarR family transcriptional regulator [Streptomyces geranii]